MTDYLPKDFQLNSAGQCFVALAGELAALEHRKSLYCPWEESFIKVLLETAEVPAAGCRYS